LGDAPAIAPGGIPLEAAPVCFQRKRPASRAKKGAIVRRLRGRDKAAAVLAEDETTLRLFPPLRQSWSLRGAQARVAVSGRNDKRVLFGSLNIQAGSRVVTVERSSGQEGFQTHLRKIRKAYGKRPVCLLLDRSSSHVARKSVELARELNIELIWLPKQWSEYNAMDQLWKELKGKVAANRQYESAEQLAQEARRWVEGLSNRDALQKAGIRSPNYWLKNI
jgi:hypothetical protein